MLLQKSPMPYRYLIRPDESVHSCEEESPLHFQDVSPHQELRFPHCLRPVVLPCGFGKHLLPYIHKFRFPLRVRSRNRKFLLQSYPAYITYCFVNFTLCVSVLVVVSESPSSSIVSIVHVIVTLPDAHSISLAEIVSDPDTSSSPPS